MERKDNVENNVNLEFAHAKYIAGETGKDYTFSEQFPIDFLDYSQLNNFVPDMELIYSTYFSIFSDKLKRTFSRINKKGLENIPSKRLIQLSEGLESSWNNSLSIDFNYSKEGYFEAHPNLVKSELYHDLINNIISNELDRRILEGPKK